MISQPHSLPLLLALAASAAAAAEKPQPEPYDGPDEQAVRDAARANDMPADEIFEVPNVVLPR